MARLAPVGYYGWILCGCAGASGEGPLSSATAQLVSWCTEIKDVSDGSELHPSGVCGGNNVVRQYEEDSKSGVLSSSASTCLEPLCTRGHDRDADEVSGGLPVDVGSTRDAILGTQTT
jgi:hypothetical protein